jgi:hypothetical protein
MKDRVVSYIIRQSYQNKNSGYLLLYCYKLPGIFFCFYTDNLQEINPVIRIISPSIAANRLLKDEIRA